MARGHRTVIAGTTVALLWICSAWPAAARSLPAACPGGRFPVAGDPLVPGGPVPDAIEVAGLQVSINSGCPAVAARRRRTRKRPTLVATWAGCGGLRGRVRLVLRFDAASCDSLSVRFRGRHVNRRLRAQIEVPPDAFGRAGDPLPDGATLVTQEQWDELKLRPDFRSIGPAQAAADHAADDQRAGGDADTVSTFLAGRPDLEAQYLGGVDPGDPSTAPADGDGQLFTFTNAMDEPQTVVTMGPRSRRNWLATLLRRFPAFDNQLGLYRHYYDALGSIDPALPGSYPTPDQASQMTLADLLSLNASIAVLGSQYLPLIPPPGGLPPPGYPASCNAEEQAGDGSDRDGTACSAHKPLGVYLNRVWPLKFYTTCVKDQGSRGTCWGFGTTAAVEVQVAKQHHRWLNLSEQHLVFMTKHIWYPSTFGDTGGPPLDVILDTGYAFPFEAQWDYNQSLSRTVNAVAQTYRNSCLGYGGAESAFCSDTNHQGQLICFDLLSFRFCAAIGPLVFAPSGYTPSTWSYVWDTSDTNRGFANIVWAVGIFQRPVIIAFPVTPSFDRATVNNGYVGYVGPHCPVVNNTCTPAPSCECDRGGHIALVTGLVDNTDLPVGAPMGAGGGYVILKNSWGPCYGDAGYAYLPYQWVKSLVSWAAIIGDVN